MPVSEKSQLKTVSLVLTKVQVEAIERLARRSSNEHRTVSRAEAAREIFSAGIAVISHVRDMHNDTSTPDEVEIPA